MARRWSSEGEAEASGSSASEQVKAARLKAVVSIFKQLGFGPPTGGCPNQIVLVGGAPPMSFWGIPS